MQDKIIKVGDEVIWRGGWGSDAPRRAKIVAMELCENERDKYGVDVSAAYLRDKDRLCVTLDTGNWAYGFQIQPL